MTERIIQNADDLDLWFAAPGFEGVYEITRCGKVRSIPRYVNSPVVAGGRRRIKGKLMTLQLINGYPGFIARRLDGTTKSVRVHRLVALAFVANPEGKPHINHLDGVKTNANAANLEWVTHAENMQHAYRTGLIPPFQNGPGDQGPAAKLDWPKVRQIRSLLGEGFAHAAIGKMFGVKKGAIGCISRNETWRIEP